MHAAALQYVRKVSGATQPSQANQAAFDRAVLEVTETTRRLLEELTTTAPPKDRDVEAAKARARGRRPLRLSDVAPGRPDRARTRRSPPRPATRSCPARNAASPASTGRCRSARGRPTASRGPCAGCSSSSTSGPGTGCSTWAAGRAGPRRCWPTSSGPPARSSVSRCFLRWWRRGRENLGRSGRPARVEQAEPGVLGCPAQAPFDRVLVSAAARASAGRSSSQLGPVDGVLVVPVAGG